MLNGDERTIAEAVTREPGLDRVDAEVLSKKNVNREVLPQAWPGGTL
jgi:cation transport ATPase